MKFLTRSFLLFCLMLIMVCFREDTLCGYKVAPWANSVCAGDLDLDGFAEILVGSQCLTTWGGISILKNTGWGSFQLTDSVYSHSDAPFIKMAQLDDDPHPEMIFLKDDPAIQTDYLGIIFNNDLSDSLFLDTHTYDGIDYLATGDLDGNGHNDIIFASKEGRFWGVFYRYGNISCPLPVMHHVTQYDPTGLDCKDLNNDGRDDVVLCGQLIDVYLSTVTGFINLHLDASGFMDQVALTDIDHDGYRDIVATKRLPTNQSVLLIYKNLGNNTFQRLPDVTYNIAFGSFFIADFNNDGLPDILFSLYNVYDPIGYHLLYNEGDFQFTDSLEIPVQTNWEWGRSCYCLDLDNNGFADIITTLWGNDPEYDNVEILFNDGQGHFQPDPVLGLQNERNSPVQSFTIFPNPFSTKVSFSISADPKAKAVLSVADLSGKFITRLESQRCSPGRTLIEWNGKDRYGSECPPGVYLVTLFMNNKLCASGKVIRLCE